MRVLAIDTALAACAAAVLDTEHGAVVATENLAMTHGHAEALMPLVARVMDRAGLVFGDIDRVVVTTGPGSFTGLRVGIAAARGIALAAAKPAVGLSTLVAYAAPYIAAADNHPVVAAIDARHDHVYFQVFGPGGRGPTAPRLAPLRDAVQAAATAPACIVGSAAQSVAAALSRDDATPTAVDPRPAPDIAWIARIGAGLPESPSPPKPQYLRAPDAQPQNAAQLPRR
ncbi:MAG TPA: tRNA (adenosine(37)-N6)-threonylcarbamoyltransferase complex dimerization subunit type 1 TsaB [Xanthobacteraceae bacterium]|nr:tRNA (adenosine(37)-N6)-threonylcarbamoyltransferase complex dimerization subunit type 1 TsaB [Xanthobacteraceae bacterium]